MFLMHTLEKFHKLFLHFRLFQNIKILSLYIKKLNTFHERNGKKGRKKSLQFCPQTSFRHRFIKENTLITQNRVLGSKPKGSFPFLSPKNVSFLINLIMIIYTNYPNKYVIVTTKYIRIQKNQKNIFGFYPDDSDVVLAEYVHFFARPKAKKILDLNYRAIFLQFIYSNKVQLLPRLTSFCMKYVLHGNVHVYTVQTDR